MNNTEVTIHFTDGQVVTLRINAKEEFDAYCELGSCPSVKRLEFHGMPLSDFAG